MTSQNIDEISVTLRAAEEAALLEIGQVHEAAGIAVCRAKYLGKKSEVAKILALFPELPPVLKKSLGQEINGVKSRMEKAFAARQAFLSGEKENAAGFDPTLTGITPFLGKLHPLTRTLDEIKSVFAQMGFATAEGPEVEDDWHNFEALNHPPHHPARDMQDTFYVSEKILLRTHTSPVQIRIMEKKKPPIRIIVPGRVYRNEEINARSFCMFHQVEGLFVDEGVSFAELKGTLQVFVERFFGKGTRAKFRPSYFPFTEPSAEVDIECFLCKGQGCPICKRSGWLEILGCGMVNPNVFKAVGIDAEKYTGFAFGIGIERITLLKYGINDIRLLFENDRRFLEQF